MQEITFRESLDFLMFSFIIKVVVYAATFFNKIHMPKAYLCDDFCVHTERRHYEKKTCITDGTLPYFCISGSCYGRGEYR